MLECDFCSKLIVVVQSVRLGRTSNGKNGRWLENCLRCLKEVELDIETYTLGEDNGISDSLHGSKSSL